MEEQEQAQEAKRRNKSRRLVGMREGRAYERRRRQRVVADKKWRNRCRSKRCRSKRGLRDLH